MRYVQPRAVNEAEKNRSAILSSPGTEKGGGIFRFFLYPSSRFSHHCPFLTLIYRFCFTPRCRTELRDDDDRVRRWPHFASWREQAIGSPVDP